MSDFMNNNFEESDQQLNSLIQRMAQDHLPELPSPGVIWWRAQIQRKMEDRKRVERPMAVMRLLAGGFALLVTIYLLTTFSGGLSGSGSFSVALLAACLLAFGFLVIYLISGVRESTS